MASWSARDDEPLGDWQARVSNQEQQALFAGEGEDALAGNIARPTPALQQRAPLIDQVTNSWRDEKQSFDSLGTSASDYARQESDEYDVCGTHLCSCDLDDEGSAPNLARGFVESRRGRKMMAYALVVVLLLVYIWQGYLRPTYEDWTLREGFLQAENGTFGVAKGGDFLHGDVKIADLEGGLLPGGKGDKKGKRRLVFVGDIHGCKGELLELLKAVGFDERTDHLVATGDVISKGPDSRGVLDELIRLKATSVRGNHEDRILTSASTILSLADSEVEALGNKWAKKDAKLLKHLKHDHLRYLQSMPLILRIPALPHATKPTAKPHSPLAEEILVVHGGLVPSVPLSRQDPYSVMNMRSLHPKSHVPSSDHASAPKKHGDPKKPWTDIWNWYSNHLFRNRSLKGFRGYDVKAQRGEDSHGFLSRVWQSIDEWTWRGTVFRSASRPKPQVVVYGHDSKSGLSIKRWTKGLDSGCVKGEELTAMVLDAKGRTEIVSVKCKKHI